MSGGGEHQYSADSARVVGGRYRLIERIGSGGMGTVWRAHDDVVGRDVAVKQPRLPGDPEDEAYRRAAHRLYREARSAARVDHPCAVSVHDVVEEDGLPWIVMELVRGQSLHEVLRGGPLEPAEAARVGLAVLGALRAAHAAGIVHRDVKPANVLIEARTGRVVLTDFGIAHVQGEETLTVSGEFVGSLEFVAPERMSGRRAGPASDLWSLGVLLYAAVEGWSPFRRTTVESTLAAILTTDVPEPQRAGALGPLLVRLLEKDPAPRADAEEAAAALEAVARGAEPEQWPAAEDPAPQDAAALAEFGDDVGTVRLGPPRSGVDAQADTVPGTRAGTAKPSRGALPRQAGDGVFESSGDTVAEVSGEGFSGDVAAGPAGGVASGSAGGGVASGSAGGAVSGLSGGGAASGSAGGGVASGSAGGAVSGLSGGGAASGSAGGGVASGSADGGAASGSAGGGAVPAPSDGAVEPGFVLGRPAARRPLHRRPAPLALVGGLLAGAAWFGVVSLTGPDGGADGHAGGGTANGTVTTDTGSPQNTATDRNTDRTTGGSADNPTDKPTGGSAEDPTAPEPGSTQALGGWIAHPEKAMAATLALPPEYQEFARQGNADYQPRVVEYAAGSVQVRLTQWDRAPGTPLSQAKQHAATFEFYGNARTRYSSTTLNGWDAVRSDSTYGEEGLRYRVVEVFARTDGGRMYELRVEMPEGAAHEKEGTAVFQGALDRLEITAS